MKDLTFYINQSLNEAFRINKDTKLKRPKYFPENKKELKKIIGGIINKEGNKADLNCIDTSQITDMSYLFHDMWEFNGNVSNWNVSNVTDMHHMFYFCRNFNCDISGWDVSNVTDMNHMFVNCLSFNQDISKWNVSNVKDMSYMFSNCASFIQDLSDWKINRINKYSLPKMFYYCPMNHKPEFCPKFR